MAASALQGHRYVELKPVTEGDGWDAEALLKAISPTTLPPGDNEALEKVKLRVTYVTLYWKVEVAASYVCARLKGRCRALASPAQHLVLPTQPWPWAASRPPVPAVFTWGHSVLRAWHPGLLVLPWLWRARTHVELTPQPAHRCLTSSTLPKPPKPQTKSRPARLLHVAPSASPQNPLKPTHPHTLTRTHIPASPNPTCAMPHRRS